jgi:hypothetical protein
MKSYKLLFVYGYNPYVINIRKPYVITTREDSLASAIKRELKTGALLCYIKEVIYE